MCVLESHLVFVKITGSKFFNNFVKFIFLCFYGLFYCAFNFYFTRVLSLCFTSNLHKLIRIMVSSRMNLWISKSKMPKRSCIQGENDRDLRLFRMNIGRFFQEFEFGEWRLRPLAGSWFFYAHSWRGKNCIWREGTKWLEGKT
jgi:hypothetical protein